ncbi:hypothetical protein HBH56_036210 [Parastagonospora nodorum]|uniref:F-box domain-containing protein n=2 Tax=Phaeosphaeria nodorum (strain SN15 / ATCC MYA-4574 / FGSC 10173) TaxID=321614 RepID=A0A7U2F7Z4_PHANO|nr:hypothetical protein SNOG_06956 [Parastagonospora nodorum SN15]KAH3918408.1 hypothetical protein HBH56_036210 [Parastagonospora nodorum]EAT85607.1 hypothetical protein SNOG_06956 [Parastagonospora nodorum SN15]KAH3933810.1 hypothetical protein HBH54_063260 [Parastagonospora nodorum]KAH3980011.1 hypothetical protein HBH52_094010 [Parastagonospora nodorum]KAH4049619.1 hypothetical protein HBH49_135270 [Parastagonospora nodorum]
MSSLQDLPLELHLYILQSSSLDILDLVRYRAVSPLWRAIIDTKKFQERLFLRPLLSPILPVALIGIAIIAVIRPVPITTTTEYNEGLYNMTLKAYTCADPDVRSRLHPIVNDLGNRMHLLNHNFVRTRSAWVTSFAPPSMRFRGMKQLGSKIFPHYNANSPASWRAMSLSQNQYDQFQIYWALDMRLWAKTWERVGRGVYNNTVIGAKMRDLETQCRLVLRQMVGLLDEDEDGEVVSKRKFWLSDDTNEL